MSRQDPGGATARPEIAHVCASFPPDPLEIRRALMQIRRRFTPSAGEDVVGRLELVLAEVLNNIAEHGAGLAGSGPDDPGHSGKVYVSAATAIGGIYCIVSDQGLALPTACLAPRSLPQSSTGAQVSELPEGGFGWFMIQHLASRLYYGREGRRNILAFLIPHEVPVIAA